VKNNRLSLQLFFFSNCNINPNPTHLPKHQTLSPNHQFSQRVSYVECYSVHANMAWNQKFRFTPVVQPPTLLQNVLFCLLQRCAESACLYYGLRVCEQKYITIICDRWGKNYTTVE